MKVFHKYTGFIIAGVVISIIAFFWITYTADQVFFESWSCQMIDQINKAEPEFHTKLTDKEHLRWHEILLECKLQ